MDREADTEPEMTKRPQAPLPAAARRPSPAGRVEPDYRQLVHAIDGIVWEADARTFHFTFVSEHAERLLGYPAEEWLRDPSFWPDHIHPDDRGWAVALCQTATREGRAHDFEYRMLAADGRVVWIRDVVTVVMEDGEPVRLQGVMVDVSEHKRTAEELERQKKLFEATFRHVPDAMVIANEQREVAYCNPAIERVFGYTPEEVVGRSTRQLYASDEEFERLGRLRFNRHATECFTPDEATFRRKSGELFPVETVGTVIRDEKGNPLGFLGVMRDVTRARAAAREVRASEQRFRDFAAASSDWFWEMDEELRFSYFSERFAQVTGVDPETLMGKTREETGIPNVDPAAWRRHLADLAAHRPFRRFVHPRTRPDGETVWLAISATPVFDEAGRFTGYRGTGSDITETVRAEQELRASEARFRDFAENAADWFWETDADLRYTHLAGRLKEVTGVDPDSLIGRSRMDFLAPNVTDPAAWAEHVASVEQRRPFEDLEYTLQRPDGDTLILRASGMPVFDEDGKFTGYRGAARDVTEERRMARKMDHQARHDSLTGLVNRHEFEQRLERMIGGCGDGDAEHALCYLDLDQFKVINDTCGHVAGDELLRQVGALLRRQVRRADTVARLGGDEFGVLMEHCRLSEAHRVANDLRDCIQNFRFSWDDKSFGFGVSIGLVPISRESAGVTTVMSAADTACYAAKDRGRNRIHVFLENDAELHRRHGEMQWVSRIHSALEEGSFELSFQPIVSASAAATGGAHYELLLRMRDGDDKLIPPGAFLPAAERYGVSSRLDRWVISTAVDLLAAHPAHMEELYLCSINVSGHSLTDEEFLEFLVKRFERGDVDPRKICFEVTETAAIANLSAAARFIGALKGLGCKFALDDFGSGLSSFAYLKNLDVDFIKIDGQFVKDIASDPIDRAMVKSINEIGQVMGKKTIAEFVENERILAMIRGIGIDYAQGYGVGRPKPLAELLSGRRVA